MTLIIFGIGHPKTRVEDPDTTFEKTLIWIRPCFENRIRIWRYFKTGPVSDHVLKTGSGSDHVLKPGSESHQKHPAPQPWLHCLFIWTEKKRFANVLQRRFKFEHFQTIRFFTGIEFVLYVQEVVTIQKKRFNIFASENKVLHHLLTIT